jgi:hypothetical protein
MPLGDSFDRLRDDPQEGGGMDSEALEIAVEKFAFVVSNEVISSLEKPLFPLI